MKNAEPKGENRLVESIKVAVIGLGLTVSLFASSPSIASEVTPSPLPTVNSSSDPSLIGVPGGSSSAQDNPVLLADNQAGSSSPTVVATSNGASTSSTATATPVQEGSTGGKFPVTLNLSFLTVYESNIDIRHTNVVGDLRWEISPGLDYATGDPSNQPENYFHVSYAPTFSEYLDHTDNDFVGQNAVMNYQYTGERLTAGVNATYLRTDYPVVDADGRLAADYYNLGLFANYHVDNRLNLVTDFNQALDRYEAGINTNEWYTDGALDYAIAPRTTVGVGARLGYLDVIDKENQYYEQGRLRLSYLLTQKITLSAYLGGEVRQYEGGGSDTNPVAGLTASYFATSTTRLTANIAYQSVPSVIQERQNYQDAHVDLTLHEDLPRNFYCQLFLSYDNNAYYSTSHSSAAGLTNNYFTIQPTVGWKWTHYFGMSAYYSRYQNFSTNNNSSFEDNSVGLQLNLSY